MDDLNWLAIQIILLHYLGRLVLILIPVGIIVVMVLKLLGWF
jgi:hypothetical protein